MSIRRDFWNPDLYEILSRLSPGKAAFDFDNTLVRNDFGEAVMELFLSQGVPAFHEDISSFFPEKNRKRILSSRFKEPLLFRSLVLEEYDSIQQNLGLEASYRWSSWIFSGHSPEELKTISRAVWNRHAEDSDLFSVKIYEPMKELVNHLQSSGWEVWIVTASPQEIIQSVSSLFEIPEEKVLGMRLSLRDGIHSSEILEPFTYGEGKVARFQESANALPDLAFGDSVNDFPLLESSKLGVFLNREKGYFPPKGTRIQSLREWKVLEGVSI